MARRGITGDVRAAAVAGVADAGSPETVVALYERRIRPWSATAATTWAFTVVRTIATCRRDDLRVVP